MNKLLEKVNPFNAFVWSAACLAITLAATSATIISVVHTLNPPPERAVELTREKGELEDVLSTCRVEVKNLRTIVDKRRKSALPRHKK